ncbi:MAG: hypothetical protein MJ154_01245 [Candidatus Saccharibacteria bacterium]|nr:hypothetical protein [Candidatus Saccharibacteria bacterium]
MKEHHRFTILNLFSVRNFCIAIVLAIFIVLASYRTAFSTDVTKNLTITEAKLYRGSGTDYELNEANGITSGTNFRAHIEWHYESSQPIADGDTASFIFGTQDFDKNGTTYHVRDSKELPITNDDGMTLGYWTISNRKINMRFSDDAVGHYILEGFIDTVANNIMTGYVSSDKNVSFPIADKKVSFTKKANTMRPLSDQACIHSTVTNGTVYWDYYTPGITINEFYRGNGQVALTEKATLSNLSYETTLSDRAIGANVNIYALAQLPLDSSDASAGAATEAKWLNVSKLFTRKYQAEGQSYENFYTEMQDGEYGVYRDENGRYKVAVKFGSQPSNITYAQALAVAGYKSSVRVGETYTTMPEVKDVMNLLDDPNTVAEGKVLRFVAEIGEQIPTSSGGMKIPNNSEYTYTEENGEDYDENKNNSVVIPVGSAVAEIIGEARLQLVDEVTKKPLANRDFILQEKDGDVWKDLDDTRRTTDNDGFIQVLGLTPNKTYRWQQINFAEHYDEDSFKVSIKPQVALFSLADDDYSTSFTMPSNAGINFLATNALETFNVKYELGAGSNDDDIEYTQNYGDTTNQPNMDDIAINEGYTFEGWNREIAPTVTEDVVYVAKWSSVIPDSNPKTDDGTTPEDPFAGNNNVDSPLTYDGISKYAAILGTSVAALAIYFAPSAIRAYRVYRYRRS